MSRRWIVTLVTLLLLGLVLWLLLRKPGGSGEPSAEALRLNNEGIGLMEQFKYAEAAEVFTQAAKAAPGWRVAEFNRGLALLNTATPENLDLAIPIFEELLRRNPDDIHAHYSLGMILFYRGQVPEAYPHYLAVTKLDPNDPHGLYHAAKCHPEGAESVESKELLQKALALNPYLNAARYALAMHPHDRDDAKTTAMLNEMEALKQANWELEYNIKYSEMGKYAECLGREATRRAAKSGPLPTFDAKSTMKITLAAGAKWATKAEREAAKVHTNGGAILLLDFDEDDKPDILLLSAVAENGQLRDCLLKNEGGGSFRDITKEAGLTGASIAGCVGDFDNDGKSDLFLAGATTQQLWRNTGGKFVDVTQLAGWETKPVSTVSCGWLDLDQDGDLDLVLAHGSAGVSVWLNVGEAPPNAGNAVVPLSAKFKKFDGLPKEVATMMATQVLFTDLDGDRDIDLAILSDNRVRPIFNDRLLRFRLGNDLATPKQSWRYGLVIDGNADETTELFLLGSSGSPALGNSSLSGPNLQQAVLCDLDLDSHSDILGLSDKGAVVLLHNDAGKLTAKPDVLGPPGSEPKDVIALACVDLDGDCVPDVLLFAEETGLHWRKGNPNGNRAVRVKLTGKRDKGSNLRTNTDGVGCWVSALAGDRQAMIENTTLAAGPGQSRLPLVLGIGPAKQADTLRVRWPDAVPQAELNVPTCEKYVVAEINRKGTSCPVLLSWDGTKFVFITDLLGGGALAEMGPDGSYRAPRPEESVAIEARFLQPKNGEYHLKLAEPMDEVMYLDSLRLAVVDHPADWRILPDERFSTGGPAPTQELLAFRQWHHPKTARDQRGKDVRPQLTARDGQTVGGFLPRSWLGYAEEHFVELDFGEVAKTTGDQRLFLVLAGWTDYPYPESIYAASQAGVTMLPPVLEELNTAGQWKPIADIGFPAGLPKWMTFEVTGKLTGRPLRIRTNLQIYWDEIAIAPLHEIVTAKAKWHDVKSATLEHRGFMREVPPSDPRGPVSYDDTRTESVAVTKWKGRLTKTGDVTELLTAVDDRHVLCGPGDELTIRFPASESELPPGWKRSFVLRTWGYCKDTAPFTATGGVVGPIPFRTMSQYPYGPKEPIPPSVREYDRIWNTRRMGR